MTTYPQKITFGELRASGIRDVLVYCRDHRCSHKGSPVNNRYNGPNPRIATLHCAIVRARESVQSTRAAGIKINDPIIS
jgi:hypothetical protein